MNRDKRQSCHAPKSMATVFALVAGIVLLLGTESEYCISNIIGLAIVYAACRKLNLFYE